MPKVAKELGALAVGRLSRPGTHAVGGVAGLVLQITSSNARSWILRAKVGNRRREIGLGPYPEVPLALARDRARKARAEIWDGGNPVERKRRERQEARRSLTFADAAKTYIAIKAAGLRSGKHAKQWDRTIATYATPVIGTMPLSDIRVQDVQRVLAPIWTTKAETASRLRGRIEAILDWSAVNGHRTGDNPARWKGNLQSIMSAKRDALSRGNHGAISLRDATLWFAGLRQREGMGARALEFLTLTAARSGEVRGMKRSEFDLDAKLWIVPAIRMKMKREHRVPLCDAAIALLQSMPVLEGGGYVFAATRGGMLSDMSLSAVMRRMHADKLEADHIGWTDSRTGRAAVPHGVRSTFRDWAAERTDYPSEMAEIALAHHVGDATERAYRRGDMMEKRRIMMNDWSQFLRGND